MDMELTNEAAELIGAYIKGGKDRILAALLACGGIVSKSLDSDSERVYYSLPNNIAGWKQHHIVMYSPYLAKELIEASKSNEENQELTNEAAELIGAYIKGGRDWKLVSMLERGGVVRKEIEPNSGRIPGRERVLYYFPDGDYACYDPARARAAAERRSMKQVQTK
jgi:hypothetical protein